MLDLDQDIAPRTRCWTTEAGVSGISITGTT